MNNKEINTMKSISKDIRPLCREYKEEQITTTFLSRIEKNYHVRSYTFTHIQESINGCDWLWIITTNVGAFYFAIQAKKLHHLRLRRSQVNYCSQKRHGTQIRRLKRFAFRIGATPIYVLYGDRIDIIKGCPRRYRTEEGVFFDFGLHVESLCSKKELVKESPFPISCMFNHIAKMCVYENNDEGNKETKLCVACTRCATYTICKEVNVQEKNAQSCILPFNMFFKQFYNAKIEIHNSSNEGMLLLLFGKDILSNNEKYLSFAVNMLLGDNHPLVQRIIVQDYMIKHEMNYAKALMGEEFIIHDYNILDPNDIDKKIKELGVEFGIFKRIGFFGSYARQYFDSKTTDGPTKESDIDIVFEYDCMAFKSTSDLLQIPEFIRTAFQVFHKNIDFVDNNTCDEGFAYRIRDEIQWSFEKAVTI